GGGGRRGGAGGRGAGRRPGRGRGGRRAAGPEGVSGPEPVSGPERENPGGENTGSACRLRSSCTDSLEWVALRLALVDCEFTVQGPPELVEHLGRLGARLTRAASAPR
ncbi:transcriptional regulator, partial [Streptomyces rhizosphaericola]